MTTRFSPETDPAIFGLLPRPCGKFSNLGLTTSIYKYAVMSARFTDRKTGLTVRDGNVGPALVDIHRSSSDPSYKGISLVSDDRDWVFMSPISWHPNGKKAMWREVLRTDPKWTKRMRIVELLDYVPGTATYLTPEFPSNIPYAISPEEMASVERFNGKYHGKIKGDHSGWAQFDSESGIVTSTSIVYHHFSHDGKTFWDGMEKVHDVRNGDCVYEGKLTMTGEQAGEMDFRATFRPVDIGIKQNAVSLDFSLADDGKPASYGYATYNGVTLRVDQLTK